MTSKTCPSCGKDAEGRFCSSCGSALGGVHCTACGAEAAPGARFCNKCGATLGAAGPKPGPGAGAGGAGAGPSGTRRGGASSAGGGGETSKAVWALVGVLLVALILAVVLPVIRGNTGGAGQGPASPMGGTGGATGPAGVDISSMTPRQAADQLFDRIMRAASAGDTAQVMQFYPMGVQAYEMARPLDADGLFHLALIQQVAGDNPAALEAAGEALAVHPNHLLNLSAAGASAAAMGDTAQAREYYQRLVSEWDAEMDKGLVEYEAHGTMMPELLDDARSFLEATGGSADG